MSIGPEDEWAHITPSYFDKHILALLYFSQVEFAYTSLRKKRNSVTYDIKVGSRLKFPAKSVGRKRTVTICLAVTPMPVSHN